MHEYLTESVGLFIYIFTMNYLVDYCYEGINANVCRVEVSLFISICIFLFIIKSYTTVQYGDIQSHRFLGWVADRADRCLILAAATFSFLYEQTTHRCHLHGQLSLLHTANATFSVLECTLNNSW